MGELINSTVDAAVVTGHYHHRAQHSSGRRDHAQRGERWGGGGGGGGARVTHERCDKILSTLSAGSVRAGRLCSQVNHGIHYSENSGRHS